MNRQHSAKPANYASRLLSESITSKSAIKKPASHQDTPTRFHHSNGERTDDGLQTCLWNLTVGTVTYLAVVWIHRLLFGRLDRGNGSDVGTVRMSTLLIFDMVNCYPVNRCLVNGWIMKWRNGRMRRIRKLWTGIESVVCDAANRLCLRNGCRKLTGNCSAGAVWSCETVRSLESESVDRAGK